MKLSYLLWYARAFVTKQHLSAQTAASPSGSQSPSPPRVESEDYPLTKMADHDLTLGALGIPGKGKHYVSWKIFRAYARFYFILFNFLLFGNLECWGPDSGPYPRCPNYP